MASRVDLTFWSSLLWFLSTTKRYCLRNSCVPSPTVSGDESEILNHLSRRRGWKLLAGLPWCLRRQRTHLQWRRCGLDPWVGKIPWRREWQPTPVFWPGKSPWTEESLVGYSRWGLKELDMTEQLSNCWETGCPIRTPVSAAPCPPRLRGDALCHTHQSADRFCTGEMLAVPHRLQMSNRGGCFGGSERHPSPPPVALARSSVPGTQRLLGACPEGLLLPRRGSPALPQAWESRCGTPACSQNR